MMRKRLILIIIAMFMLMACKKDWLDKKNDIKIIVPTTIKDMRLLLNNTTAMEISYVALGEIASDNMYLLPSNLATATSMEQIAYVWGENAFSGTTTVGEWDGVYNQILTCNVVLEGLAKVEPSKGELAEWNDVKGAALFFRARAFFDLLVMFTKPYQRLTAANDLGIPLRLSADITAPVNRQSLLDSYMKTVTDLKEASQLLRERNKYPTDANRPAALGLLARVYLSMGEFDLAKQVSSAFLDDRNDIFDFNLIDLSASVPFVKFNPETVFYATLTNYPSFASGYVNPQLINLYQSTDLRLKAYFKQATNGLFNFKGSYTGSEIPFAGFTASEVLLTRAECNVRLGLLDQGQQDLEMLMRNRYLKGSQIPKTSRDQTELLQLILAERRKELVFRGVRWMDLKRFNQDENTPTLLKIVDGKQYTLPPFSNRYVFAIPDYIIKLTNLPQNPR